MTDTTPIDVEALLARTEKFLEEDWAYQVEYVDIEKLRKQCDDAADLVEKLLEVIRALQQPLDVEGLAQLLHRLFQPGLAPSWGDLNEQEQQNLLEKAQAIAQHLPRTQAVDVASQPLKGYIEFLREGAVHNPDYDWVANADGMMRGLADWLEENAPHIGAQGWREIESAPKDGTLVLLRCRQPNILNVHPTENELVYRTIGFNNLKNDGEDAWKMAGWCWSHDHFTEGHGEPIAWQPLPAQPQEAGE